MFTHAQQQQHTLITTHTCVYPANANKKNQLQRCLFFVWNGKKGSCQDITLLTTKILTALPLFLVWLQVSWLVVLFGAELPFAEQNVETYEFEPDCLKVSGSFKKLMALNITHLCVKNFHEGEKPLTADQISHLLEVPIRLARQILFELTEAKILSEVRINDTAVMAYQPALDIENLTVHNVLEKLDTQGSDAIPIADTKELQKIKVNLNQFQDTLAKSPANIVLKNL